jgi:hypothetical protein
MNQQQAHQIRGEILQLLHDQVDALEEQTFVGLPEDKLREFDPRAERIHKLVESVAVQSE